MKETPTKVRPYETDVKSYMKIASFCDIDVKTYMDVIYEDKHCLIF